MVVSAACATTPRPGDSSYPYNLSGQYAGVLAVDDQRFAAELTLTTSSGGDVDGAFRVRPPFEIDGRVIGVLIDGLLRLTVTYQSTSGDGCNGQIEGILTVAEGGGSVDGPVTIADCGDPIAGRMSFRR